MNSNTKQKAQELAKAIIEDAAHRLLRGILQKNVLRHIESKGIPTELANKMLNLAEKRANELSHYKIGKYSKEYNHVR